MKLFNYLKLTVVFSILIFAFSCNDNENLDEIIEPELELMGRENSFTTDGIIVKDENNNDDNNETSENTKEKFIQFCFSSKLTREQKDEAIKCWFFNPNIPKPKILLLNRINTFNNCEVWAYIEIRNPRDGDGSDIVKDDDLLVGKNINLTPPQNCDDSINITHYYLDDYYTYDNSNNDLNDKILSENEIF
ncbi:hypothetical protein [uncultured Tenacibaculum sp.]|uniref:hypothetical protein n=1 Tax=uncultured Tenacibaculum sp. TaxID=174713 RepID=UPI00260F63D1|nr:hypothetical protein [uncultured Tenacibaculum sp.]